MSSLNTVIGNAKRGFVDSVSANGKNSLSLLAQGNLEGAVSNLLAAPGEALNAAITGSAASPGDGLGGINARGDAIQNWCWYCTLPPVTSSSALSFDLGISLLGNIGPLIALPWYYVQTANVPARTFATDSIQRNGHAIHFPESYSVDDLTLGLFMDTTGKAWQYINAWQGLVMANQDPKYAGNQGMWGLPAQYKKDIKITILSVDRKQMLSVRYINCFPKNPAPLELVSSSSEALVVNVNFAVEDVYISVSNDKGLISNLLDTAKGYALGALSNVGSSIVNNITSRI